MKIYNVNLTMKTPAGKLVYRVIDITNLMVQRGEHQSLAATPQHQRALIEDWIQERGCAQHNATSLELISFYLS